MGRAMRAGVRVGFFACLCLCRERPLYEGFIPSVTAEGSEGLAGAASGPCHPPTSTVPARATEALTH